MFILIIFATINFHYLDSDKMVYFGGKHMAVDVNKTVVMQEFSTQENCERALEEISEATKLKGVCIQK